MANIVDKLKQRSNSFNIILNDSGADVFKSSKHIFNLMTKHIDIGFIALILHDNEFDKENQRVKTNHYHVVFTLSNQLVSSLNNMLNTICDIFKCNANQVSIEKCNDLCASVRYLIHLDNCDKEPYLPFDVVTNNMPLVGEFFSRIREICDVKEVVDIAKRYNYDTESIMLAIGERNWRKWRVEFQDLKRDKRW